MALALFPWGFSRRQLVSALLKAVFTHSATQIHRVLTCPLTMGYMISMDLCVTLRTDPGRLPEKSGI